MMELLVSMLLSSIVLAVAARDFGFFVQTRANMDLLAETQQAASASMTFLTQELRQAGACLPELGDFISLEGEDDGSVDSLTLRIGIADEVTLECNRTILETEALQGESQMKVEDPDGFAPGQWVYLIKATGKSNFFEIASIDGQWITIEGTFDRNYGSNSGVYAYEERRYEIFEMNGVPVLTVAIDGSDPIPMVRGVERLDVRYRLDPCPPCYAVDEPSDDAQWRTVREVDLLVGARSSRPALDGEHYVIERAATVRPRNFL